MKKGVNILYVLPTLGYGGAELQTINQINYLIANGNDHVYLLILSSHLPAMHLLKLDREKVIICDQSSSLYLGDGSFRNYPYLIRKTSATIKKKQISHIISILPMSHFICRMAKLKLIFRLKLPKLFAYYRALDFRNAHEFSLSFRFFLLTNTTLAFLFDSRSIFNSLACKENISSHFFVRKPFVIDNCVPFKDIDSSHGLNFLQANGLTLSSRYNILFPGRFFKTKGHKFFLEAVENFINERGLKPEDLKILIAGHGTEAEELTLRELSKNLNDYLIFTGMVENEVMMSLMKVCDLVVIPSLDEGFGNVAIEALMQKAIVLASDAGGLKNIIEHEISGFQFKAGDECDFLDKLASIYDKHPQQPLLKENIFKRYKDRYGIEIYFDKLSQHLGLGFISDAPMAETA